MDGVAGVRLSLRPPRVPQMRDCRTCQWVSRISETASRNLCSIRRVRPAAAGKPAGARNAAHCTVLSKIIQTSFPSSADAAERNCLFIAGNDNEEEKREANASSHPAVASVRPSVRPRNDTLNSATAMRGSIEGKREILSVRLVLPSSLPRPAVSRSLTDRPTDGRSDRRPRGRPPSIDWHSGGGGDGGGDGEC